MRDMAIGIARRPHLKIQPVNDYVMQPYWRQMHIVISTCQTPCLCASKIRKHVHSDS